ncbi:MAG: glycosyltransferase family 39 protein [Propionivibrio sp.]
MQLTTESGRGALLLALIMLGLLTAVAIAVRPMTPIDETRYISVAWEMWLRGDFLVPFKNGAPYSHKPPLMIWLYQAGWALFGVNVWWPRLVSPLASAISLWLTMRVAQRLWPQHAGAGSSAVLILASCLLWTFFSTAAMFDVILALFTLLGMYGTLLAADGKARRGMVLLGVSIGLGVLAKGPVILLHTLPAALLAGWWNPVGQKVRWFGGVLAAILIGAAIALAWAVPAGLAGGDEYRHAIFWGQTADRMVESFAHRRPVWWYLPLLPVLFMPWFVWPGLWGALRNYVRSGVDRGGRFCVAWMLPVVVAFSFISGKQPHYLIPVFPAFALLAGRAIVDRARERRGLWLPALIALLIGVALLALAQGWMAFPLVAAGSAEAPALWPGILLAAIAVAAWLVGNRVVPSVVLAMLGVAVSALVQIALFRPLHPAYDVRPIAVAISQVQQAGHLVAHLGMYHDQYHFAGRLRAPLLEIDGSEELGRWLTEHPEAYAVVYVDNLDRLQGIKAVAAQRYLDGAAALLDARSALLVLARAKTSG